MNTPDNPPSIGQLMKRVAELEKERTHLRNVVLELADAAQNHDISESEWEQIERLKTAALHPPST